MNINDTTEGESTNENQVIRNDIRTWLKDNWDQNRTLTEWRNILIDSGWGVPAWPEEWYGKNLPIKVLPIIEQEFDRAGAVTVARSGIRMLAAATILEHGSIFQKTKFLRRILTGEDSWCQLFSEPGSGSDLAGSTTRAEFENNKWVVNGQKVWTTNAHNADYGLLLARTNWEATKHDGLSYFIINMRQPGIEVHPLKQMNGYESFNQVFLTDAEILPELQVDELGKGWAVAMTTLMHERRAADTLRTWSKVSNNRGQIYDEERAELEIAMEPYRWYPQRAGRVDLVIPQARATGKFTNPIIRQEIAKLLILSKTSEWTALRARAKQQMGLPQGPEGSIGKLAASQVARKAAKVHTMIAGSHSMLSGIDGPLDGIVSEILISTPAISIAGGTDEIQRNIISERVLGMPKELRADQDLPFHKIRKNTIGDT